MLGLGWVGLLVSLWGCSTWSPSTMTELPLPRMPKDSVVLETAFVNVPPDADLTSLWREVDEQHLTAESRRTLAANGIRSGVVGTQMPEKLRELIDAARPELTATSADSLASANVTTLYRRLQNRVGERAELVVVPAIPDGKVILFNDQGRIRAETFQAGQAHFAVRSYPSGDGSARVDLVPEIKHGDMKQQWVPGHGTFLYDARREQATFEHLRLDTVLTPGQTLVVTCTDDLKGLGGLMFSRTGSSLAADRLLLLVRLSQTQYDDLFAPEQAAQPLSTPLD